MLARNEDKKGGKNVEIQNKPIIAKRLANEIDEKRWASLKVKRKKIDNPRANFTFISPKAKHGSREPR